jgi:L-alanine-DL-glutamate epimerase-like enolase superfamily enzyme
MQDVTEPFVLRDGYIDVPNTVGIGMRPIAEVLDAMSSKSTSFPVNR